MSEQLHEAHVDEHGAAEHGHGEGHGSPFIQHHYDDAQHQFDAGKLGIWLFLAQEVLFFSALFVAYILYRYHHPEIYSYAHKYLDVKYGAINTAVLIFSSLTAAWGVRCAQLNQRRGLILCIALTIACACAFLGIKYIVRQLRRPRAPDPQQQLRRHQVDHRVGLRRGQGHHRLLQRPRSGPAHRGCAGRLPGQGVRPVPARAEAGQAGRCRAQGRWRRKAHREVQA
ncbi:MAG: hypothetical protein E6J91_14400 [Deltaproteobacteria bacterium]|nr:MAG: hypothetical protein E6J91_14400 [Deltaproteobacteria bacterium]